MFLSTTHSPSDPSDPNIQIGQVRDNNVEIGVMAINQLMNLFNSIGISSFPHPVSMNFWVINILLLMADILQFIKIFFINKSLKKFFFKEHWSLYSQPQFLRCYGITQLPNGKFTMVLQFASFGDLRLHLQCNRISSWKDKIVLWQRINIVFLLFLHFVIKCFFPLLIFKDLYMWRRFRSSSYASVNCAI